MLFFLTFVRYHIFLVNVAYGLSCINNNGLDVDWFTFYKASKQNDGLPGRHDGTAFYISDSLHPTMEFANMPINNKHSAPLATLQQAYDAKKIGDPDTFYLLWNDQHQNPHQPKACEDGFNVYNSTDVNKKVGHSKGAIIFNFNENILILITHSIPCIPLNPFATEVGYPPASLSNGQSGGCFVFNLDKIVETSIANMLLNAEIDAVMIAPSTVVNYNLLTPEMRKLFYGQMEHNKKIMWLTLKTKGNMDVTIGSKPGSAGEDLNTAFAQREGINMIFQTWRRPPGNFMTPDLETPGNKVVKDWDWLNLEQLDEAQNPDNEFFYNNHGKFGLAEKEDAIKSGKKYYCNGDTNRMASQYIRGGLLYCYINQQHYDHMEPSILAVAEVKTPYGSKSKALITYGDPFEKLLQNLIYEMALKAAINLFFYSIKE